MNDAETQRFAAGGNIDTSLASRPAPIGFVLMIVFLPPVGMGTWALGLQAVGNIHVVEQGQLYRSAQLGQTSGGVFHILTSLAYAASR
jgi:hypothetical protein